jgi:orotate phosphoribosyltransferase
MTEEEVVQCFKETRSLRKGHFRYDSGKHGEDYVNKDLVGAYPNVVRILCEGIGQRYINRGIEVVVSPTVGAVKIAHEIALYLSRKERRLVLAVFVDKDPDTHSFVLKRGFPELVKGKNILVAEDVINTGESFRKVVQAVQSVPCNIVAGVAWWNRGMSRAGDLKVPELCSLVNRELPLWDPEGCPLCKEGIPIDLTLGKKNSS